MDKKPILKTNIASDLCAKTFADTRDLEQNWMASVRTSIETFLIQEGVLKADRKYGYLFRIIYDGKPRSVASGIHTTALEALNECLELIGNEPAVLVQEYELHEIRSGIFKKQYTCELIFRNERFSGFSETAFKFAREFAMRRPPDDEKAAEYLKLCDSSDPETAALMRSNPYTDGGTEPEGLFEKGMSMISDAQGGLVTRGALYVIRAADAGCVPAMAEAGKIYENGTGLTPDSDKALLYYSMAADKGDVKARFKTGELFAAKGTAGDLEQAFRYYRMAADGGDPEAQYRTAICLAEGRGTRRNRENSLRYLKLAADQGNEAALRNLSIRDEENRAEYLNRLSDGGNLTAQVRIALAMLNGNGMQKDPVKAFALLKDAADKGSVEAGYRLGLCYKNGTGTRRDPNLALSFFRSASERGHLKAYAEAESLGDEIARFDEGEKLCRIISRLHDERRFEEIFEIYTEHDDILQDKDVLREVFKDYVEIAADPEGVQNAAGKCTLPEAMNAGDYFYDIAVEYEEKGSLNRAVTAYAYAALEGNRKAFAVLASMASENGRYFISVDDTLLV